MTTKVKAPKYRVRRTPKASAASAPSHADPSAAQASQDVDVLSPDTKTAPDDSKLFDNDSGSDGFGEGPFPGAAAATKPTAQARQTRRRKKGGVAQILGNDIADDTAASSDPSSDPMIGEVTLGDEVNIDAEIDTIRREGLTGRQLRLARRVAKKHGIAATSDFDAVRLLRKQGIDPFQRGTMLEMVTTETKEPSRALTTTEEPKLPQTINKGQTLPSPEVLERLTQEDEISKIQQDIARRRQRKMLLLGVRLLVFIGIPTVLAGIYFYKIASPMYGTESAFVIQQADSAPGGAGGLASALSGSPLSTSQDSIAVQDYLMSRDAMLRLDADAAFRQHFASEAIDPIQRLSENASNEETYKVFEKRVTIGYDPTEGLLRMEVVAASPEESQKFSDLLVQYAEEQVDQMSQRLREDQMKGARESLKEAEATMMSAQEKVVLLQEKLGIISADAETQSIMTQISGFETQLQEKKLELQALLDNSRPNAARVDGVRGDIRRLENLVSELRQQLTTANNGTESLARITAELRMAELDLATRQAITQQAIQALELARTEANRQVRYLSMSSRPVAPDEPTYPRKFENTLLAMLVFSGIYLMASLTAAVLREQVSA